MEDRDYTHRLTDVGIGGRSRAVTAFKAALGALRRRLTIRSVTRFLFLTTQLSALLWVNWSFALATYATVRLQQPLPLEALSETAINVILGTLLCKVLENALEHNDGGIWGKSKGVTSTDVSEDVPESGTK